MRPMLPVRSDGPVPVAVSSVWPAVFATWGPGAKSGVHSHHAMHLVVATRGVLRVATGAAGREANARAVLTQADVAHAIDGRGADAILVFVDPESDVGELVRARQGEPVRLFSDAESARILGPLAAGELTPGRVGAWIEPALASIAPRLSSARTRETRVVHPRVRRVLRVLREGQLGDQPSLGDLAAIAGLSEGRLMHAFTASVGIPVRPYLLWMKLQRAAIGLAGGEPLARAAAGAGFSDAAHMTRTFRRMFGMTPSALQKALRPAVQPERSRRRARDAASCLP